MRIAILGPVCKDIITIDGAKSVQLGGIPYYTGLALYHLGKQDTVLYATYGKDDEEWVSGYLKNVNVRAIPVERSHESHSVYWSENPDVRENEIRYTRNTIEPTDELFRELETFDTIILAPLFHDDVPFEFFERLRHKNLVHGNFGLFTYGEEGQFIRKNPENLLRVLPYLDALFLDIHEGMYVSGKESVEDAAATLLSGGVETVALTDGSRGSYIFRESERFDIPAFPPHILADPTGAGDTYLAAYVRATELFGSIQRRGEFAAMVATISLEKPGAFDSNIEEVYGRLGWEQAS